MKTMELLKEYALLNDNIWLFKKLEVAELEVQVAAITEVTNILGIRE